jgi:Photosynthetic reaction centre cytochrome C subunit
MFLPYKKIIVLFCLAGFSLLGILAAKLPLEDKPEYKNLKVLSKNIRDEDMDYVMQTFSVNLGANCLFCHPGKQEGSEFTIDYVTDVLQNKQIAREMLKMTMKLNKKYFNTPLTGLMNTRGKIWCRTCHQGSPVPILPPIKIR